MSYDCTLCSSLGDKVNEKERKEERKAEVAGSLELRSSRPAWAHGETPSLQKIQNLAGHGGAFYLGA